MGEDLNTDEVPPVKSPSDEAFTDGVPQDGHSHSLKLVRGNGAVLWSAANAWQRAIRWALEPLLLTHVQYMLLENLSRPNWNGNQITQAMLSRHTGIDEMMTSHVIRTLETKGLVFRRSHSTDSRAKVLGLTPKGIEVAHEAMGIVESTERKFFGPMGESLQLTIATLEKVLPPLWPMSG